MRKASSLGPGITSRPSTRSCDTPSLVSSFFFLAFEDELFRSLPKKLAGVLAQLTVPLLNFNDFVPVRRFGTFGW